MRKYICVVFLVIFSRSIFALEIATAIDKIEQEWATVYYGQAQSDPSIAYQKLLDQAQLLAQQFPAYAEPLLWQAIIVATDANHQPPLKALEQITCAHGLLMDVLAIDPKGVNGSAQVTLGTLYYMTPPWPIAFGDTEKAEHFFLEALSINPDSIEANYFYGDFLLAQDKVTQAEPYLEKALSIPVRKRQSFADQNLQHQAALALENADRKLSSSRKIILSKLGSPLKNN